MCSKLEAAIFTSYGTDFAHLQCQLAAMRDKSKVIVCDTYDHTRDRARIHFPELHRGTHEGVAAAHDEFVVVHPCMDTTVYYALCLPQSLSIPC